MAMLCFGLFAGAMALNAIPLTEDVAQSKGRLWNAFQFGLPLLMGGMCLTRKRWAYMAAVIYCTLGLALDLATFVQSLTGGNDPWEYLLILTTTAVLNFLLILLGGRAVLQPK